MENNNIEINFSENQKELIIREGAAELIKEPKIINLEGTIQAPKDYYEKRKDKKQFEPKDCHVIFSYDKLFIKLVVNESNHYSSTIIGKALKNPDLEKFGINSGNKLWTKNGLKQFLKMNRAFFKDIDSNLKMVTNLEKFSAAVQIQIDQHKDDRGNSKNNSEVKIDSNLDMSFDLQMPIFIGQKTSTFKVEICFDVRDNGITIWLESPELQETIIQQRQILINENIDCFKNDFALIEQ
jgi:hypothetical protein